MMLYLDSNGHQIPFTNIIFDEYMASVIRTKRLHIIPYFIRPNDYLNKIMTFIEDNKVIELNICCAFLTDNGIKILAKDTTLRRLNIKYFNGSRNTNTLLKQIQHIRTMHNDGLKTHLDVLLCDCVIKDIIDTIIYPYLSLPSIEVNVQQLRLNNGM
jgi:hypothetical protein